MLFFYYPDAVELDHTRQCSKYLSIIALIQSQPYQKRIWPIRIKDFVAIHDGDEVLGVGEVDDVVGIAREHDDALNLVSIYFIFKNFSIWIILVTKLNKSVTADYYELLPLGVMPMLSFCDSWFGDVYADLTAIQGMNEFCETASVIDVHLEVEDGFPLGDTRDKYCRVALQNCLLEYQES